MTQFYWINIGKPSFLARQNMVHQDWWNFLRYKSIFAIGFEDSGPEKGRQKTKAPDEGDILLAYASTHGAIGYGVVGSKETYRHVPKKERDDYRHQRHIDWRVTIDSLADAIPVRDFTRFGLSHLPGTLGKISNADGAAQFRQVLDDEFGSFALPEEIASPELLFEGAKTQITVNAYERNPEARAQCLEAFGYACSVCGFDFKAIYGEIGRAFIHVHHLTKLSDIGKEYVVNPITDLRPVCANCHAMIHRRKDHYTIEELQAMIGISKQGR